jgi:hypothetical protein
VRYVMIIAGDESNWFGPEAPAGLLDEVNSWWDKWHADGKIVQGGFIHLVADDIDDAVAVAAGWPGIPLGDLIEVRPVMER